MGGIGSGNWCQFGRNTVDESLTLAIWGFHGRIYPQSKGKITWTWADGDKSSIGYFVNWDDGVPTVTLHYRWGGSKDVRIPIQLQATPTNFGGERWWFTCPVTIDGVACKRRVGKLHLPLGAMYFGCRKCHDLTYQSCQEAHQTERLFSRLGLGCGPDIGKLLAARLASE